MEISTRVGHAGATDYACSSKTVRLLALIAFTFAAGCGGGGSGGSSGGSDGTPGSGTAQPDTTPPTTPTALSAASTSSSEINLAWNSATDNDAVSRYRVYQGGAPIANVTATTYTVAALSAGTQYCYSVTATDAAGNESPQSTVACATTRVQPDSTAPIIAAVRPTNSAVDVDIGAPITVEFSEPINAATLNRTTFTVVGANAQPVAGSIELASATARFTPDDALAPMETYSVTLATGIQDLAGNPLAAAQTWSFKTGLPTFEITAIGEDPSGAEDDLFTIANDVNDSGEVVGEAVRTRMGAGNVPVQESIAFLWRNGSLIDLGSLDPLGKDSRAQGINARSEVVGWSYPGTTGVPAFLAREGAMQAIGLDDAYAINDAGQIVGFVTRIEDGAAVTAAVIWQAGRLTEMAGLANPWNINEAGDVVGFSYVQDATQATRWRNGVATPLGMLTGALNSDAFDTNRSGQIIGVSYFAPPSTATVYERAVLWRPSGMIELPRVADTHASSTAYGMNDRGEIVGRSGNDAYTAALWVKQVAYDLNALIAADDPLKSHVTLLEAREINNRGQIIAQGSDARRQGSFSGYLLTPRRAP